MPFETSPQAKAFDEILKKILGIEGEYSDHPSDPGGKTRWGITKARARAHGYTGKMKDLPLDLAKHIYRVSYWNLLKLDDVYTLTSGTSNYKETVSEMMDIGVNMGVGRAGTFLQMLLNVLNQRGKWYSDIVEDGLVGPMTLASLEKYMARRKRNGALVLAAGLNALQGSKYVDIARAREKSEDFVYGWLLQRVAR